MVDGFSIWIDNITEMDNVEIYSSSFELDELFNGEWFSREFIHYIFIDSSLYIEAY